MKASKRDPRVYLEDIVSAITKIYSYVSSGEHTFFTDEMIQDAVIRQISVIGEAASKLPASIKANRADIPWKEIIGMRNILIHDYSEIDLKGVWEVIEKDLPILRAAAEAILVEMPV